MGRDRFPEEVSGEVCLIRHGIAHVGPTGELITTASFSVTRAEGTRELITNAPCTRYTCEPYMVELIITAPFSVTRSEGTC